MSDMAAFAPAGIPVPGLEPWWWPMTGRTRARTARAYAAVLDAALGHVRYGPEAEVTVNLTFPPRLARRYGRRAAAVRRWVRAAVVASSEANATFFTDLYPDQVAVTVAFDAYADRRWGDAVIVVRWREHPVIR
jgi:hypothetical protein